MNTRTYYPHQADHDTCVKVLALAYTKDLATTSRERDALNEVAQAYDACTYVMQDTICRAHDAIARAREQHLL